MHKPIALTLGSADSGDVLVSLLSANGVFLNAIVCGEGVAPGTRVANIYPNRNTVKLSKKTLSDLSDTPLAFYSPNGGGSADVERVVVPKPSSNRRFQVD